MTLKFMLLKKKKKVKRDTLLVVLMDFGKETELPWTGSRTCNPRTSTKTKGQQRLIKTRREIYFPAGSQTVSEPMVSRRAEWEDETSSAA